jgi:uncharacterized protein with NAD-binding domain and iron-sulfur cluster
MYKPPERPDGDTRQRLVILGGGMAALSAAYELTSQPDWRSRFSSITLYQMGWRLGGKCASSRGSNDRIQEHGIHAFLGSYHNTLPMLRACYRELAETEGGADGFLPLDKAFVPQGSGQIWEFIDRRPSVWPQEFPENTRDIDDVRSGHTVFEMCMMGFAETLGLIAVEAVGGLLSGAGGGWLRKLLQKPIEGWAERFGLRLAKKGPHPGVALWHRRWRTWLQKLAWRLLRRSTTGRRGFITLDHLLTIFFGCFAEDAQDKGFEHFDDRQFNDWLKWHGAHPETLKSPLNLNHTNITYQYPNGDTSAAPKMAAGAYARWALLCTRYYGHYIWRFGAGSGETLVAPLYEVLRRRGVKFEFFHKVRHLEIRGDRISKVRFDVQAHVKDSAEYRPLKRAGGKHRLWSWPERPHFDQLVEGEKMLEAEAKHLKPHGLGALDLESYWSWWKPAGRKDLLAGAHFDQVILGLSIGAFPYVCNALRRSKRWADMVDHRATYATQHMQIWLREPAEKLGLETWNAKKHGVITTTYLNPFNQHVEWADLVEEEDWPEDNRPKSLWYFSGLLMDDEREALYLHHAYPKTQFDRVKYQSIQYLQAGMAQLLPKATPAERDVPGDAFGFDFELLSCPHVPGAAPKTGIDRFDDQFWKANIDPTERYVGCPPGGTQYRLKAWDSSFANLVLAGDWTFTGLNVGSVEGAVMGGRLASHALTQHPPLEQIVGYPWDDQTHRPTDEQLKRHVAPVIR